jgi:uncharacterized protein (TIGR03086 family)
LNVIADRYRRVAASFTDKVAAVPADRWGSQSPCEEWTARDVVRHVIDTHGMFLGLVGRTLPELPPVDADPLGAWTGARDSVQADLDDPERAAAEYDGYFGRTNFAESIDRFISSDLLIHGWDLARAAALDERLDPDEVHRVQEESRKFGDAMRSPGICGPALEPAPGASEQDALLAFYGRQV